ncbi:MAG: signal recognition particle-docking protein FtsY [Rhodospirillales bacterium]|nr:signal recognition particle-docking protein FtsY [Rhodospirillales bacterium]
MPAPGPAIPELPVPGAPGPEMPAPTPPQPEILQMMHSPAPDAAQRRDDPDRWLGRLRRGLGRSSSKLAGGIGDLFHRRRLDDEALEELEDLLITADLGVETARKITRSLAKTRFNQQLDGAEIRAALADEIAQILEPVARTIAIHDAFRPHVILVCGVNGSGKTTTIAKLAHLFKSVGFDVMLAAADTFRAAAVEQLQIWGARTGCRVIARSTGADAASLAFSAYEEAKAQGAHVLLIDTAGRLHNKVGLMEELQKICRVLKKLDERAPHDCLLVLDATVGQNAHNQVQAFREMVNVSGLAVTKLDGSAKGGVVVALAERFALPVYAIGVGEGLDDMRAFEARAFARSLLDLDV